MPSFVPCLQGVNVIVTRGGGGWRAWGQKQLDRKTEATLGIISWKVLIQGTGDLLEGLREERSGQPLTEADDLPKSSSPRSCKGTRNLSSGPHLHPQQPESHRAYNSQESEFCSGI